MIVGDEVFKDNVLTTSIIAVDSGAGTITVNSPAGLSIGDEIEIKLRNTLIMNEGEAWFEGIPFSMRGGKDALVSGTNLSTGIMLPVGGGNSYVTVQDEPAGLGKLITFSSGGTTTSGTYRLAISAREEVITSNDDPFLKNANIPESTGQKMRVLYRLNMAPEVDQDSSPAPYTGSSDGNFVNEIEVTPSSGGNGEEISRTIITGSEQIDGRNLEIIFRNNPALGGGNPIPNGSSDQQEYANGNFIDSVGNVYHINTIFNDPAATTTQVVVRLDKEVGQPDPQIVIGQAFKIKKRDIFVTDDIGGNPQGSVYWPLATVEWDQALGFTHKSKVVDLRSKVINNEEFQEKTNIKFGVRIAEGGDVSFDVVGDSLVDWTSDITLINAYGPEQTIATGSQALLEGGSLTYLMDLDNGGSISLGSQALTISSVNVNEITFSSPADLTSVRIGNVLKVDGQNQLGYILDIDNPSNKVTLAAGHTIVSSGASTIYLDSFGPGYAPVDHDRYVMAVRKDDKVYFTGAVELASGETNRLGGGVSENLLTFIGATDENDDAPNYPSATVVTQGSSLVNAIGELDAEVNNILTILNGKAYDERTLYPTGLAALTTITIPVNSRNAGIQEVYDPTAGELEIYVNGRFVYQDEVWESVSTTQIRFFDDLPDDTEIHFRIDTLGGSGGGGGGGTSDLQDAYNLGSGIITTIGGKPFTVDGAASEVAVFDGDIEVTGVIL